MTRIQEGFRTNPSRPMAPPLLLCAPLCTCSAVDVVYSWAWDSESMKEDANSIASLSLKVAAFLGVPTFVQGHTLAAGLLSL